jgi:hypothetical protein
MLELRTEQVHVLQTTTTVPFIARLAAHLRRFFRERCASFDDDDLRRICEQLVGKGRGYGIVSERDLCKLANLAFTLGLELDTDPALPWARAILTAPHMSGPTLRVNRLYLAAIRHLQAKGADR